MTQFIYSNTKFQLKLAIWPFGWVCVRNVEPVFRSMWLVILGVEAGLVAKALLCRCFLLHTSSLTFDPPSYLYLSLPNEAVLVTVDETRQQQEDLPRQLFPSALVSFIQHLFPLSEPIRGAEEVKLCSGTWLDVSTGLFWSGDESVLVAELKGLVKNVNSTLHRWGVSKDKRGGLARVRLLRGKYQSQG